MKKNVQVWFVLASLVVGIAACNGDDDETPPAAEGEACDVNANCENDLVCEDGVCAVADEETPGGTTGAGEGEACQETKDCDGVLTCEDKVCTAPETTPDPGKEGDACTKDEECEGDLICDAQLCAEKGPDAHRARLTDVLAVEPQPGCVEGGLDIVSGLDANDDGTLQTDEIDSHNYLCDPQLHLIVRTENLLAGDSTCAQGGLRLIAGFDDDDDGKLGDTEIFLDNTTCRDEAISCNDAEPLTVTTYETGSYPFGSPVVGVDYPVTVQLSRPVHADSLIVQEGSNQAFTEDPEDLDYNVDETGLMTVNYRPATTQSMTGILFVQDQCGATVVDIQMPPAISDEQVYLQATPTPGEYDEGDDFEVCIDTWNMDGWICNFEKLNAGFSVTESTGIELNGCATLALDADQITATGLIEHLRVTCTDPASPSQTQSQSVNYNGTPKLYGVYPVGSSSLPTSGGYLTLNVQHVGMTCDVTFPGGEVVQLPDGSEYVTAFVSKSGYASATCKDADDQEATVSTPLPITVGSAIASLSGNLSATNNPSEYSWSGAISTVFLDGTCELTIQSGDMSTTMSDLELTKNAGDNGTWSWHSNGTVPVDGALDPNHEVTLSATCTSSDGTVEDTLTR